jgi:hypothetical protein
MDSVTPEQPTVNTKPTQLSVDTPLTTTLRDSVALRRLMEEVRCGDTNTSSAATAYDRAHNRHNR